MNPDIIQEVRENNPLIHHLTNQVVMNFTANGLLSFGGAPIMAKAEQEAHEIASIADGVLLNIGTLTPVELPAMIAAGKAANEQEIPVVLDPVGVPATSFRTSAMKEIVQEVKPTVIKGNAGEMAHLVQIPWETKGVDSLGDEDAEGIVAKVATDYDTTAIVTGTTDLICTGGKIIRNKTGHSILAKVTGAGCLLGSILTACLTTRYSIEEQALAAIEFYGLAAEFAASHEEVAGSGTFIPRFIDALSLETEALERRT